MKSLFIWTIFSFNTSFKKINIQNVENCEKNFKVLKNCDVCREDCRNGACVKLSIVIYHIRTVHEGRFNQCAVCSKKYYIEGRLRVRYHKRTVHEIKFTTVMCAGRSTEVKKTLEVICGLFIELKCLDWIIH